MNTDFRISKKTRSSLRDDVNLIELIQYLVLKQRMFQNCNLVAQILMKHAKKLQEACGILFAHASARRVSHSVPGEPRAERLRRNAQTPMFTGFLGTMFETFVRKRGSPNAHRVSGANARARTCHPRS